LTKQLLTSGLASTRQVTSATGQVKTTTTTTTTTQAIPQIYHQPQMQVQPQIHAISQPMNMNYQASRLVMLPEPKYGYDVGVIPGGSAHTNYSMMPLIPAAVPLDVPKSLISYKKMSPRNIKS
jgi:hypothetical protein